MAIDGWCQHDREEHREEQEQQRQHGEVARAQGDESCGRRADPGTPVCGDGGRHGDLQWDEHPIWTPGAGRSSN
jgi:hypothetical protein